MFKRKCILSAYPKFKSYQLFIILLPIEGLSFNIFAWERQNQSGQSCFMHKFSQAANDK